MPKNKLTDEEKIQSRKKTNGKFFRLPGYVNSDIDGFVSELNKKSTRKITKTEILLRMVNSFPDFRDYRSNQSKTK